MPVRDCALGRDDGDRVTQTAEEDRGFLARDGLAVPPTFTPAFLNNTVAASLAARAIAGSLRTRSCAIEPVNQQGKLRRQCFRVRDTELYQQVAKPEAAAFLEGDGNLSDRPVFAEFGNRIDEGAAAKILR